jgi:hypothetical protein
MKNIEKIAIDTIVEAFANKNQELIQNSISMKAAADMAVANFKKAASGVNEYAKIEAKPLLEDGISEEAEAYFEQRISEITKIPFKIKN